MSQTDETTDLPQFVLQSLFDDESLVFRVHNVKNIIVKHDMDLPQMFLAHYDSLADEIKAEHPLTADLLKKINQKTTAEQANTLLGLPSGTIRPAHHIKITGTAVIVCDSLPVALHISFTNTAKSSQALYGNEPSTMIEAEAQKWQLAGLVNVLHKNPKFTLISHDLSGESLIIEPTATFIQLPNAHALATTHAINTIKHDSPSKLQYLHERIVETVLASVNTHH